MTGARRFVEYLRTIGIAPQPKLPKEPRLILGYREYMIDHRGISEKTLRYYATHIKRFLIELGDRPKFFTTNGVRAFILAQTRLGKGLSFTQSVVKSTRSFLRYLSAQRVCTPGLENAVPKVARWRLSSLPRYLPATDIRKLVIGCNVRTEIGARDRAILLLMSQLGLRAGDIRVLKLGDIDWKRSTVTVSGKSARQVRLPLPQESGDALLRYVTRFRPRITSEIIFLCCQTPIRPFSPSSVSAAIRQCFVRAGIKSPTQGGHCLRHSAATQMLRDGASLQDVAAMLRHASLETTMLYAKVDVTALQQISQSWPEVSSCL